MKIKNTTLSEQSQNDIHKMKIKNTTLSEQSQNAIEKSYTGKQRKNCYP